MESTSSNNKQVTIEEPISPKTPGSTSASASGKYSDRPSRGLSKTYSRESLTRTGSIHSLPDDLQMSVSADSAHSFSPAEKIGFSQHINQCFEHDPQLSHLLPLDVNSDDLFKKHYDGLIFCKMINLVSADAINFSALNLKPNLNVFQKTENINVALNAAKKVGIRVVNIGAQDLLDGRPTLILGLTWQLIKAHLLGNISLRNVPELIVLLQENEDIDAFHRLPPEQILLRWVNYHAKKSGLTDKRASNFGADIADSEIYRAVIFSLNSQLCHIPSIEEEPNNYARALRVISSARSFGIATFIKADDIVEGTVKLNIGFVAQLFNKCHGLVLEPPVGSKSVEEAAPAAIERKPKYPMIPVADAIALVLDNTQPLGLEMETSLINACGRVSAGSVFSPQNYPTFPASIMDGYALVGPVAEGTYELINSVRAGDLVNEDAEPLLPGQCVYITTGAKLPKGADTVVKVEDTTLVKPATPTESGEVYIKEAVEVGTSVRQIGSDIAEEECLLTPGRVITPVDVGLLATIGCGTLPTFKKPVIGVMSTGNELIEHTLNPVGSQIRDSNRVAMIAAFRADGYECIDLGIIPDSNVDEVSNRLLEAAKKVDVCVTSGGVSMGDADYVKPALEKIGTVHFGKLNMKPGKPTMFATVVINLDDNSQKRTLFFGLPGNPVSCLVTKSLLIDPCLKKLQGRPSIDCLHPQLQATLVGDKPIKLDPERPEYHRAFLTVAQVEVNPSVTSANAGTQESSYQDTSDAATSAAAAAEILKPITKQQFQVRSTGNQRSSRLLSMRGSNAVLCLQQGPGVVNIGDEVTALLIGPFPKPTREDCFHQSAANVPDVDYEAFLASTKAAESTPSATESPAVQPEPEPMVVVEEAAPATPADGRNVMKVGVLTVSDRASKGEYKDESGPELIKLLIEASQEKKDDGDFKWLVNANVVQTAIVPDSIDDIQTIVKTWVDAEGLDVVLTTGGTGFGRRDLTPEAITPLLHRHAPGVAQALVNEGLQFTPLAALSRPVAGTRNNTLIATLPGSVKAIRENFTALKPLLPRIVDLLQDHPRCHAPPKDFMSKK